MITIDFNCSNLWWGIVQREISKHKLCKPFLTHWSVTAPFPYTAQIFFTFQLYLYLSWNKHNMAHMLLFLSIFSIKMTVQKFTDFVFFSCILFKIFYWRMIDLQNLLFSIKPQHELAIGIYKAQPFWTSLPSPYPSHPSRLIQSPIWVSWAIQQIPVGYLFYIC